jgi:hypothetical protein
MGTGLFDFIAQACQSLAATVAPSVTAMGIHIVLALATIVLGLVRRAGGARIGARRGRLQHGEVSQPLHAAHLRLRDGELLRQRHPRTWLLHQGLHRRRHHQSCEPHWVGWFDHHAERDPRGIVEDRAVAADQHHVALLLDCVLCRAVPFGLLAAIVSAILAYGAIAATIIGLLGPIFIPFLVFDKLDWLFWGWLKAYLGFSFYKVIAAATMNVLSHVLTNYYIQLGQSISDPSTIVQTLPLLILLVLVNVYILFKIPAMTHSLFGGIQAAAVTAVWAWP